MTLSRQFVAISQNGSFATLLVLSAVSSVKAQPVLRLGYSGMGVTQNLYAVIDKAGLWTKYNLDVKAIYFNSGSLLGQAMVGGDIDLSDANIPTMLNLKAAGMLDVKAVAAWMNRITLSFIARKVIHAPAKLKGKRIAISRFGSSSDFVTRLLLRHWKLDPEKDVAIIQSGGNDTIRMAALMAGHIDGALIGTYDVPRILQSGCCINLADLEDLPIDYARFGVVLPTSLIKSRRETSRRFLQGLIEGIYVYKTRPDLAVSVLKREGVKDAEIGQQKIARALLEYPLPEEKGIKTALESIGTPKARAAPASEFIDTTLLEEIKQNGFIDRLYQK